MVQTEFYFKDLSTIDIRKGGMLECCSVLFFWAFSDNNIVSWLGLKTKFCHLSKRFHVPLQNCKRTIFLEISEEFDGGTDQNESVRMILNFQIVKQKP